MPNNQQIIGGPWLKKYVFCYRICVSANTGVNKDIQIFFDFNNDFQNNCYQFKYRYLSGTLTYISLITLGKRYIISKKYIIPAFHIPHLFANHSI